ncbi:MAG: hypothetical protein IJ083_10380 [Clostridia bacterium]|nr:hypothetical protein [Clostridia bacterium]
MKTLAGRLESALASVFFWPAYALSDESLMLCCNSFPGLNHDESHQIAKNKHGDTFSQGKKSITASFCHGYSVPGPLSRLGAGGSDPQSVLQHMQ